MNAEAGKHEQIEKPDATPELPEAAAAAPVSPETLPIAASDSSHEEDLSSLNECQMASSPTIEDPKAPPQDEDIPDQVIRTRTKIELNGRSTSVDVNQQPVTQPVASFLTIRLEESPKSSSSQVSAEGQPRADPLIEPIAADSTVDLRQSMTDVLEHPKPGVSVTTTHEQSRDSKEDCLTFLNEICDRQYFNYTWNDGKLQGLVAINGILGASVVVSIGDASSSLPIRLLLSMVIGCISASLFFCVRHTIPRLVSGVSGRQDNLRAQTGITSHPNHASYEQAVRALTKEQHINLLARQVYGMATNNRRSHRIVRLAATFTMVACIAMATTAILIIRAVHDPHAPVVTSVSSSPSPLRARHRGSLTLLATNVDQRTVQMILVGNACTPCTIPNQSLTQTGTTVTGQVTLGTPGSYAVALKNGSASALSNGVIVTVDDIPPTLNSARQSPDIFRARKSGSLTIQASEFDPTIVQLIIIGPGCMPCSIPNTALNKSERKIDAKITLQSPGVYMIALENGPNGPHSGFSKIVVK